MSELLFTSALISGCILFFGIIALLIVRIREEDDAAERDFDTSKRMVDLAEYKKDHWGLDR